ncbi:MAG: hypothetical protein GY788_32390, partial [bacterium]|nr:hypothetical protein [bacterium]
MASKEIEKLVTTLEVNMRNFEKKLNAANNNAKRKTSSIQRNFDKMNRNVSQGVGRHFSNAAKSISVVHGPLGGVASRVSGIGSILSSVNPLLAGTSLAMTGLGFAAYKALTAFQAFETQQLVTEQVLRTTGSSAGRTASQIEALAQSVGMTTLASITGAREAATQLLTFRSISGETFDRTLRLSQDLAAVGFGSLSSAAKQLGKALE